MKKLLSIVFVLIMISVNAQVRYLPLGDSYTICEGLKEEERWPNLIVKQLEKEGTKITLLENPSRTGFTTQDLIKYELPLLKTTKPNLVTLLIGVNDYVQRVDTFTFHKNLIHILDEIQAVLPEKKNIIVITIPDYSVTPQGVFYAAGRDVTSDLKTWNLILKTEAASRGLSFVDIFPLTRQMKNNPGFVSEDGLHPSAKEVGLWAELITPEVKKLLKARQ